MVGKPPEAILAGPTTVRVRMAIRGRRFLRQGPAERPPINVRGGNINDPPTAVLLGNSPNTNCSESVVAQSLKWVGLARLSVTSRRVNHNRDPIQRPAKAGVGIPVKRNHLRFGAPTWAAGTCATPCAQDYLDVRTLLQVKRDSTP
jgi:hypothetical protein